MSVERDPVEHGLEARLAAARQAGGRADSRLTGSIDDFFLADDARLDERMRATVAQLLGGIVRSIETDIRRHAARVLSSGGADRRAEALLRGHDDVVDRLSRAGLLRDRQLMDELIARVRGDIIAAALPIDRDGPDDGSILLRLADSDDGVVAVAARTLLSAEVRRRAAIHGDAAMTGDVSAELHHRLIWWIAATIREAIVACEGDDAATDRAIVAAAQRSLAAHDEGDRVEAVAMRLAQAIGARADELAPLLIDCLRDRRLILFIACLGRALDMDYDSTRAIVIEPEGDRLWLALRALDCDRATIARIGLSLADADPRRDLERFADEIDALAAIPVDVARSALAPLTLHHDLRLAIDALARKTQR